MYSDSIYFGDYPTSGGRSKEAGFGECWHGSGLSTCVRVVWSAALGFGGEPHMSFSLNSLKGAIAYGGLLWGIVGV